MEFIVLCGWCRVNTEKALISTYSRLQHISNLMLFLKHDAVMILSLPITPLYCTYLCLTSPPPAPLLPFMHLLLISFYQHQSAAQAPSLPDCSIFHAPHHSSCFLTMLHVTETLHLSALAYLMNRDYFMDHLVRLVPVTTQQHSSV